jgi:hypothetical protein
MLDGADEAPMYGCVGPATSSSTRPQPGQELILVRMLTETPLESPKLRFVLVDIYPPL